MSDEFEELSMNLDAEFPEDDFEEEFVQEEAREVKSKTPASSFGIFSEKRSLIV